jgi:hypothetical protein
VLDVAEGYHELIVSNICLDRINRELERNLWGKPDRYREMWTTSVHGTSFHGLIKN